MAEAEGILTMDWILYISASYPFDSHRLDPNKVVPSQFRFKVFATTDVTTDQCNVSWSCLR